MSRVAVPFTDLGATAREIWPGIEQEFTGALLTGRYIGGDPVERFERAWARYCGTSHAVGVANGTDALELTLLALGVGPGDEVLVPANTFIATAAAVVRSGATPVFTDVDEDTLLLTPELVAAALTPRTRAVMVVHLHGNVADLDGIAAVTGPAGVHLVEDAAQAHGAARDGIRAGSRGVAACFSFYPGKNLGALGDAGAVVTHDAALAERIRALANHGRVNGSAHHEHEFVGTNSRLDTLQAIALTAKLARLDAWTDARIALADGYRKRLATTDVRLTGAADGVRHAYHLMVVRVPERDRVREALHARGIQTGIHYPVPCHRQPPLRRYASGPLPVSERAAAEQFSLPIFPHMSTRQLDLVCDALAAAVAR